MTQFPDRRTLANAFAFLLGAAPSIAQQGFTDAFPPAEFAARRERVVAQIGEGVAIRQMMNMCMSFDHRILDGQMAGQFVNWIKRRLEGWTPADVKL